MAEENISEFELRKSFLKFYEKTRKTATEHPDFKLGQNNYRLLSKNGKEASRVFNFMTKNLWTYSRYRKNSYFYKTFSNKRILRRK